VVHLPRADLYFHFFIWEAHMDEVSVLVVVDVEGALSSGSTGGLGNNVYLIDTNKYMGSGGEGQAELSTTCQDGQVINWTAAPVDPNTQIQITGFTGGAVNSKIIIPQQVNTPAGSYWSARVEAQGNTGSQQYSITMSADGTSMTFDPYLNIQAAP
jgi:hypothetical protein